MVKYLETVQWMSNTARMLKLDRIDISQFIYFYSK